MCLVATLTDATSETSVKLWEKAVYQICGVTTPKLKELWEKGVEDDDEQQEILEALNENNEKNFLILGTVRFRVLGSKRNSIKRNST